MVAINIIAVLVVLAVCQCAVPRSFEESGFNRIVGGQSAKPNQFPYQISLRYRAFNRHFCGGAIVHSRWIVTAAYCLVMQNREDIVVVAGAHLITDTPAVYDIAELIPHKNFSFENADSDIGLVRTAIEIVFGETVRPIPMGDGTPIGAGLIARASGWCDLQVHNQNAK